MYRIKKTNNDKISLFDSEWEEAETAKINVVNWKEFSYVPRTTGKLLYSEKGIHILMETDEKPLLARYTQKNDTVCFDSCMEFFIQPNENDKRYMNFEFNPFGTINFSVRTSRFDPQYLPEDKEYFEVSTYVDDKKWRLKFTIPFEFIDRLYGEHTKIMKGNMYKCAEEGKVEHYVSLYPIKSEKPDFHRPECFGEFVLED